MNSLIKNITLLIVQPFSFTIYFTTFAEVKRFNAKYGQKE